MASIHDILRPQILTKVVSRIAASQNTLLNFMGMQPGGFNEQSYGHGREGVYHVFNNSRSVGTGRAPGTAAGRRARHPIGRVPFTYPRMHESVSLLAEEIHNIGRIENPAVRDQAGEAYIRMQSIPVGQRAANFRTAMVVGMLKDSLYVHVDGDDWYFSYSSSGALFQINYQMPAGNKSQLDMLGAGDIVTSSFDNPSTNIPYIYGQINAARQNLGVGPVTDVHLTNAMWNHHINNDYVASLAGIANPAFQRYEREVGTRPDGTPLTEQVGVINSIPGILFHISDDGLDLGVPGSESFTKHWDDTGAVLMGPPQAPDNFTMYLGSEPIAEYDGGPETVRVGLSSWSVKRSNPTATEMFALDNALPVNHIPASVQYPTLVF